MWFEAIEEELVHDQLRLGFLAAPGLSVFQQRFVLALIALETYGWASSGHNISSRSCGLKAS